MKAIKMWFYKGWSIERVEKKCKRGYVAVIESGRLVGFRRER